MLGRARPKDSRGSLPISRQSHEVARVKIVSQISVKRRVTENAIAGTVEELDQLAARIVRLLERDYEPYWQVTGRGYGDVHITGTLAEHVAAIDMSKLRKFDLFVGESHNTRRALVSVDCFGARADVWGETDSWSLESAARLKHYLKDVRPWWWWLRQWYGGSLFALVLITSLLSIYGLIAIGSGGTFTREATYWLVGAAAVGGGLMASFAVPTLHVGPKSSGKAILVRAGLAAIGIVVSAVVGVYAGIGVSGAANEVPTPSESHTSE
jgi:hypothetical protein